MSERMPRLDKAPAAKPRFTLEQLTQDGATRIEHWFEHPEVERWLGGSRWVHRKVVLMKRWPGLSSDGMSVLRSHGWLVLNEAKHPVACIGGNVYSNWTPYLGATVGQAVLPDGVPPRSMDLFFAVDPGLWNRGLGREVISFTMNHELVADVDTFFCTIDETNAACLRCFAAAGFLPISERPSPEGIWYFRCDAEKARQLRFPPARQA